MLKVVLLLIFSTLFITGCGKSDRIEPDGYQRHRSTEVIIVDGDVSSVMQKVRVILADMGFNVEKFDIENGYIRTFPAGAGQFFELWKNNNVGGYNLTMANTSSIARIVELEFEAKNQKTMIRCHAIVNRLSFDREPAVSVSDMRTAFTDSSGGYPSLSLKPERTNWYFLGYDAQLENRILELLETKTGLM